MKKLALALTLVSLACSSPTAPTPVAPTVVPVANIDLRLTVDSTGWCGQPVSSGQRHCWTPGN